MGVVEEYKGWFIFREEDGKYSVEDSAGVPLNDPMDTIEECRVIIDQVEKTQ